MSMPDYSKLTAKEHNIMKHLLDRIIEKYQGKSNHTITSINWEYDGYAPIFISIYYTDEEFLNKHNTSYHQARIRIKDKQQQK